MPTLTAGNNITLNIGADDSVLVRARGACRIEAPSGTRIVDAWTGEAVFGPYNTGTVRLTAQVGDVFYEVLDGVGDTSPARWKADGSRFVLVAPDDSVQTLARAVELATNVTATGTSRTGAGYFAGIFVSAYNGGPQTITARDSTDNSGRIIGIFTVSATGYYWLDSAAVNSVRINAGVHLTISGGTSRTVCAVVEP